MLLRSSWGTSAIMSFIYFLYFLFSIQTFLLPIFKKKKKTIFLSISLHTYYYTSSNLSLSFLALYLPTTLPLYFLHLFYILTLLLPILFCINLISFSHSIHIFPIQNCEYSFSFSVLYFGEFLFFLITLIKVDGFFFF